jgi:DNA primase
MQTKTKFVGFDTLKQTVSMQQVLEHYGIQLRRSGDSLSGPCPLHHGHNPSQFRASLSKNCFICYSCQAGGSIIDFVSRKEGIGIRDAGLLIQDWFNVPPPRTNGPPNAHSPDHEPNGHGVSHDCFGNPPLRFTLQLDSKHPYLASRGLTPETIQTFGLGYCTHGSLAGWIAIPIHNTAGQLIAYAGRFPGEPTENNPKYKLPKGFRKSLELFNLHRLAPRPVTSPLVVVEGFFGCMKLWQAGLRHVVSLMGSMLSVTQEELILKTVGPEGHVILWFDSDEAGRKGCAQAKARLQESVSVSAIHLDTNGSQPDQLSAEQVQRLVREQGAGP